MRYGIVSHRFVALIIVITTVLLSKAKTGQVSMTKEII